MNPLEQIALAGHALALVARASLHPRLWIPWLPLILVELAWLALLAGFAHPAVSGVMAPLLTAISGDAVLHYPNVFRILPGLHARGAFVIVATLGSIVVGASVWVFDELWAGRTPHPGVALGEALRRAPALIVAQAPLHLLTVVLTFGLAGWMEGRGSSGITVRALGLLATLAATVLQALFLLVPVHVMRASRSPLGAWLEIPRVFMRAGVTVVVLSTLVTVAGFPLEFLARFTERLVERGRPELVAAMVVAQIGFATLAGFVLAGAAVVCYRTRVEDDTWA
ncbi:MAG: hypothetical protein HOP12_06290 [Candidatus Eisenbacteria bacterium]|uniref:Uncharacterized protein n=1 Tax=Eiseniibacteriota bacterium TaxID=2212470 RepID=A0A849SPA4_UNCEI|nr:hypothetical protein [Candidatus Eisenbacteria bacterium]